LLWFVWACGGRAHAPGGAGVRRFGCADAFAVSMVCAVRVLSTRKCNAQAAAADQRPGNVMYWAFRVS